jgi:membrane-associated phospholipid phosphatase
MAKRKTSRRKTAAKTGAKAVQDRLKHRLEQEKGLARADLAVAAAATEAGRSKAVRPLTWLGEWADQPPLMAGSLALAGIGAVRVDDRMRRAGLRALLDVGLAVGAAKVGKKMIGRTRPARLVDQRVHAFHPGGPRTHDWNSFPSAHSAGGFAAARALGRDYPKLAPQGLSAAVSAGAFKVLRGDHFPSDVVAGLAIGLCAEAVAAAVVPSKHDRQA